MTSHKYATDNAGKEVMIVGDTYFVGLSGRVIGYDISCVYVEMSIDNDFKWYGPGYNITQIKYAVIVVNENSIERNCYLFAPQNLQLKLPNTINDCLECGAKDKEACKEDCPNKN